MNGSLLLLGMEPILIIVYDRISSLSGKEGICKEIF